ncbi:EboA domain-containing protein [Uniformispora flossi]|uniref:EboA domain-containing protein n=1 Tax=Uniformispora flossi TaxID=3390723 RepID=UPI003C2C3982
MLRPAHPSLTELELGFRKAARAGSARWPAEAAQAAVAAGPARQRAVFASAGRACGRARIAAWPSWTCDDAARLLLLDVFVGAVPPCDAAALLRRLYDRGDAHERRAVLRALPYLPTAAASVPLTRSLAEDALRTNDHRLVAAALGPCGYALEPAAWRQGVLKCVVLGLPLTAVTGLDDRADRELASMLDDFVREREAAGRSVPPEIAPLTALARES